MKKQGDIFIAGSQTASEVTGTLVSSNISLASGTATRSTELTIYGELELSNDLPFISELIPRGKFGFKWTKKREENL